jgi:hypothetical protein
MDVIALVLSAAFGALGMYCFIRARCYGKERELAARKAAFEAAVLSAMERLVAEGTILEKHLGRLGRKTDT